MSEKAIQILRRRDRQYVSASLLTGISPQHFSVIAGEWAAERSTVMQELLRTDADAEEWPQSLHWDWSRKASLLRYLECTGFGVVCEGRWQGVMLTKTATHFSRLAPTLAKPLVYVDFIESAPWNWPIKALGRTGQFGNIGTVLLRSAVQQSLVEGFSGRVGLHSLPQSEAFYEAIGMTRMEPDTDKEDLLYFEFTGPAAQQYWSGG